MLLWLIPVVVFVALLVIAWREYGIDCDDVLMAILVAFASFLVSFLICVGVCAMFPTQTVEPETVPIYAMNDIYLQRGESKYVYMAFEEGKGLMTREAYIRHSYINYTTDTPYVEIYEKEVRNPVIRFLFQPGDILSPEYHFYIPESASVTDDFIIDLE